MKDEGRSNAGTGERCQVRGVREFPLSPSTYHPSPITGLTLVELLVTTSLMALVGGTAVSALVGGVRVWQRALQVGMHEETILVAGRRMDRDLHNLRRCALVPVEGAYDRFSFAGADRQNHDDPSALLEIGRVGYFLRSRDHVLCRSFVPYRLMHGVRLTDQCQPVLEGVQRMRVRYYGTDSERGALRWSEHWKEAEPPLAVQIELGVAPERGAVSSHTFVVSLTTHQRSPEAVAAEAAEAAVHAP